MLSEPLSIVRARRVADEFARAQGLTLVGPVLDGEAEPERCDLPIYPSPPDFPAGWYVVLAVDAEPVVLRSSRVVGVSKWRGEVRILGDAGDEG